MTRFVNCCSTTFHCRHRFVAFLHTPDNAVDCGDKILAVDAFLVATCGNEGSLVADIGNVGTRKSGSLLRQEATVDGRIQLQVAHMHSKDFGTLVDIG